MIRIVDGRGTGKTSRLMLIAKEQNALFVCADPHGMKAKADAYGIRDLKFCSYQDFLRFNYDDDVQAVVIDEMEEFAKTVLYPLPLVGYTISRED